MSIGLNIDNPEGTFLFTNKYTIAADADMVFKPAGITVDWSTVTAVSGSAVTLADGEVIPIGVKYLRYGTVVYRHTDGTYRKATDVIPVPEVYGTTPTAFKRGATFILNETIRNDSAESPNFGGAAMGGTVYKDRLLVGTAGNPAFADVEAVLPNIMYLVA